MSRSSHKLKITLVTNKFVARVISIIGFQTLQLDTQLEMFK